MGLCSRLNEKAVKKVKYTITVNMPDDKFVDASILAVSIMEAIDGHDYGQCTVESVFTERIKTE